MDYSGDTLLEIFLNVSSSSEGSEREALKCGEETWTYGDLSTISSGLAVDLQHRYGSRPTVAMVCENHPYMVALFLAVWKLRGTVVPLDYHAPADLMEGMLRNVAPACVVVPSSDRVTQNIAEGLGLSVHAFEPEDSTITALSQRFLEHSVDLPADAYPLPSDEDMCLYIYTSSASSVSNLKCVPVTHRSLLTNCRSQLTWFRQNLHGQNLQYLRVLGWSPFNHIMSFCFDLGTSTFLTGGCYIFGLIPSVYYAAFRPESVADRQYDVPQLLLQTILKERPHVFAGVPWVLDGLVNSWGVEVDLARRERISAALRQFKYFISAGAKTSEESIQWAAIHGLPLIISIGMTELGGVLFHSLLSDVASGWSIKSSIISDAKFSLVDENGDNAEIEGELRITSKLISTGYLKYESTSFTTDTDGNTTFCTGDIYSHPPGDPDRLIWQGRKDDFIQLVSGENLDPRIIEKILNRCPVIAHSCVVGNNFLSGAAQFVCIIVELTPEAIKHPLSANSDITKVVAAVNRTLAPPLRIAWSRVLVLDEGVHIPYTRKRTIFRKKLQSLFGEQLSRLISSSASTRKPMLEHTSPDVSNTVADSSSWTKESAENIIFNAISDALGLSPDVLNDNSHSTFAELGMDSAMATMIVNSLNRQLFLDLPLNTCHMYVDLAALTTFICQKLGLATTQKLSIPKSVPKVRHNLQHQEPVVIVGQALRLPGDIRTPDSFWQALIDKRQDIMTTTPADRWDHSSFEDHPSCRITFEKSGFISFDSFDNGFFGISASEALYVSPTVRLALEASFDALENANIPISKLRGTDMGVFVAGGLDVAYSELLFHDKGYDAFSRFYGTGVAQSTACGRLSYLLDVHGPSVTVETACSGGLVAFDQAVRHLESGRGETAIVCAVNTHTMPGMFGFLSAQKMTSIHSRCATFTDGADGYAASEGVVSLILKTQSAALRDNDTILGIVKATDTMHNGRSQGLVAPSTKAQVMLHRSLLERSALTPSEIDFIEAHGTGTSLGDLIEIQGINEVFKDSHSPSRPLIVGAAKTCVGHTEVTSGLVGLVKALLSFSKGSVPGLTHLTATNMNPAIDCSLVPMHIPYDPVDIARLDSHYRALVVAYGFAGTISGVVLESPSNDIHHQDPDEIENAPSMLFVVSGKTPAALVAYIKSYLEFCLQAPPESFRSICYTSCVGREHYRNRFACVAEDMAHLISQLKERLSVSSLEPKISSPRLILGFPGQGSQFNGMAADLANRYSGFRAILTDVCETATPLAGFPILPLLLETAKSNIDQSEIAQICIFVYQVSVSRWLESLGVCAHAVVGHSLGEIAAAVASGALTYELALQFVVVRARALCANPTSPGGMAAIAAKEDVIKRYIHSLQLEDCVVIAVFNGPESHVISGDAAGVDLVFAAAKKDGIRAVKLNVDQGFHSPSIETSLPSLYAWLEERKALFTPLRVPFFSTLRAEKLAVGESLGPSYWIDHARRPVRFAQTVSEIDKEKALNIILDVGPQPTMWTSMQTLNLGKALLASSSKRGKDQDLAFLNALAALFENNVTPDFSKLYEECAERFTKTTIPCYPFQRQRHYPTFIPSRTAVAARTTSVESAPQDIPVATLPVDQALVDFLQDHRIESRRVFPGIAFADFLARLGSNASKQVDTVRFHQPLVLESPDTLVQAMFNRDGSFGIYQNNSLEDKDKLCTGTLSSSAIEPPSRPTFAEAAPTRILSRDQVYAPFESNIYFGPAFRNIAEIRMWPDHVDALITFDPSRSSDLDRIRGLDPCLHMFGAVTQFEDVPDHIRNDGFFLPTAVEGFVLHTDTLPSSILCRYYLPLSASSNFRAISITFDVFSLSGELLVSCKKYSVAWIPKGVAIHAPDPVKAPQWFQNTWRTEELPISTHSPSSTHQVNLAVYFGNALNPDLLQPFAKAASEIIFVRLGVSGREYLSIPPVYEGLAYLPVKDADDGLVAELVGRRVSIILDVTSCDSTPGSGQFVAFWRHVLWVLKLTLNGKIRISSFVVVSNMAAPTTLEGSAVVPTLGAIVQGMLRVYRRETGIGRDVVWGLDIPSNVASKDLRNIIEAEISTRQTVGPTSDSIVAYRKSGANQSLIRLVPELVPIPSAGPSPATVSGITVIIGMGSIGTAMASRLVKAGSSTVVFVGRRSPNDATVVAELSELTSQSGVFEYMQADASDLASLRSTFQAIISQFGSITNIVHTAGVVNDATIGSITHEAFERVSGPKVGGAWNLHTLSEELELKLDLFVLLSSISVPLGNPGQGAYVGANSFLDSLAVYRHSRGLPGISLQLGAWESRMIDGLDLSRTMVFRMNHAEGMPLIMQALAINEPVQVIVNLDVEKVAQNPMLSGDPIFRQLFKDVPSSHKPTAMVTGATKAEVKDTIIRILRQILELKPEEPLDLEESLNSCGMDSIAFVQARGRVLKAVGVEIPMVYLSDSFSMNDMIEGTCEGMSD
ncbi:hypothetical protein B0H10DRAFT_1883603 [Mycena sp. CBHHK59/15]|nr:hypothetical protein B0H10DRAFT_1883603 [Mycena sp. CBHHK59/15]